MGLLDVTQGFQEIGQIRWGTSTPGRNGGKQPSRTATFRLTPNAENCAAAISKKWGGKVLPWEKKFEVTTEIDSLPVTLPPTGEVFRQWYELWENKRRTRWCDSQRQRFDRGECLCPHAANPGDPGEVEAALWERVALAKRGKACKPRTDLWFLLPTVPGVGLWRATTHSRKAASRLQHTMTIMDGYRQMGIFLTAAFSLTWEQSDHDGQLSWHPVPVVNLDDTLEDLALGTAGSTTLIGTLSPRDTRAAVGAQPERLALAAPDPLKDPNLTAQDFAQLAADATTPEEVLEIWAAVKARRMDGHEIFPPAPTGAKTDETDDSDVIEVAFKLRDYLHGRWVELGGKPAGTVPPARPRQRRTDGTPDGE